MEKLIKLLNEFTEEKKSEYRFTEIINDWDFFLINKTYGINQDWLWYETIISKKFLFISRLLKNNKINVNKVKSRMLQVFELRFQEYATYENVLLMLLSISDNPISDLISYLK